MPHQKKYLTASDFYQFMHCPHWPYYERFSLPAEQVFKRAVTEAEIRRQENGVAHEAEVVRVLFANTPIDDAPVTGGVEANFAATVERMQRGVPLIYQGTLLDGDWMGRPDILERHEGRSRFGDWYYVPVEIKAAHHLEKYHKAQLVFYATLLERVQGRFPSEPAIINRDHTRLSFRADEWISEFESLVIELERIRAGEKPEPVLRKSCFDTGVWGELCKRNALQKNDIALLYNVDLHKLRALRHIGIQTVDDAAEMDPQALDGVAKGLRAHGLEVMKRQAQSLKTQSVIVRAPVALPTTGLEIHFDIESDPPNDVDYLYGILTRSPEGDSYRPFVARRLEEEGDMWKEFLAWIDTLPPEYHVYHFAAYESMRLSVLEKRYGGSAGLSQFKTRLIDLKELTIHSVVFPLYFYGLKYILPFLGYQWTGEVKAGGQSIDVFETYLDSGDTSLLNAIIRYNEEDVRATAFLKDWLITYAREVTNYEQPYPWKRIKSEVEFA